jgi:aryl-alcohol dehydrogenase-like predicted oxidoreductase
MLSATRIADGASNRILVQNMRTRLFGNTELRVSEVGLGCARIGGIFQNDARGFVDLLSAALDAGVNFFDTADMYSQGESEALLGRAFRRRRSEVVIASKAGYVLPAQRRMIARIKPLVRPLIKLLKLRRESLPAAVRGAPSQDFTPQHLARAVEGSLRRLRTDHLDLFQLHSPSLEAVQRGDWLPAVQSLQRAGKIRHYGVACDTAEVARAALQFPGVSSVQVTLSLLEPGAAQSVLPLAREKGVGVIAREILGNGLLAKSAPDVRAVCSSDEEARHRTRQLVELRAKAEQQGLTLPQSAVRFASQLEGVSVALIGLRSTEQLRSAITWL